MSTDDESSFQLNQTDRGVILDALRSIGSNNQLSIQTLHRMLQDPSISSRAFRQFLVSKGIFNEDKLAADLSCNVSTTRAFAEACIRSIVSDPVFVKPFLESKTFQSLVTITNWEFRCIDDPTASFARQQQIQLPPSTTQIVYRRELSIVIQLWILLIDAGDEVGRVTCFCAPGFQERLRAWLKADDQTFRSLSIWLIRALVRSPMIFRDLMRDGIIHELIQIFNNRSAELPCLLSAIWNCCCFPEGVELFLRHGIHRQLFMTIFDQQLVEETLRDYTPLMQQRPIQTVPNHHKACGALAEMVLISPAARKECARYCDLQLLVQLIHALMSKPGYHGSKFSIFLFTCFIMPHCTLEELDFLRQVLPHFRRFVTENDAGRDHEWGIDSNELAPIIRPLVASGGDSSMFPEVRVFLLWTILHALRKDEPKKLVALVHRMTSLRRVLMAMTASPMLLERAQASGILALLPDAPSGRELVDDISLLNGSIVPYDLEFRLPAERVVHGIDVSWLKSAVVSDKIVKNVDGSISLLAHGDIIYARSPLFHRLAIECGTRMLALPGCLRIDCAGQFSMSFPSVLSFIYFCYTDSVEVQHVESAMELLLFASQFAIPTLSFLVVLDILGCLTVQNVAAVSKFSKRFLHPFLSKGVVEFIRKYAEDVVEELPLHIRVDAFGPDLNAQIESLVKQLKDATASAISGISVAEIDRQRIVTAALTIPTPITAPREPLNEEDFLGANPDRAPDVSSEAD
eukprot:ANDGO_00304.mRNA.1 hypothetical protein